MTDYAAHRKATREYARSLLKNPDYRDCSFHQLAARIMDVRVITRGEAERALKDQVGLGRCWNHNSRKGFFWRKGDFTLSTARCPHCDLRLEQTTLALQTQFKRI